MKKLAAMLAFSTVLAFGATAKAADIVEAPAVFDWTGFYIGGNIGYAFGGDDRVGINETPPAFDGGQVGDLSLNGIFGGPEVGYNFQAGSVVFGVEGDFEFSDVSDDDKDTNTDAGGLALTAHSSDDVNWFGTLRGHLGWALNNVLIYGTGGLAVGSVDYKVRGEFNDGFSFRIDDDFTNWGWTAGGGVEWAFNDNWSAKVEYKYVNLGKESLKARAFDDAGEPTEFIEKTEATPDFHSILFGVNYRF